MSDFYVTILGSGSAIPTKKKRPSSQLLVHRGRHFLIDCGEGAQIQMQKFGKSLLKIDRIFITHLHGDHYFGLVGLLSSMQLLGRNRPIYIYAPKELEAIINIQLDAANSRFSYELIYQVLSSDKSEVIYEDKGIEVKTLPLRHKVYTNGFLFKEKPKPRNIIREKIDYYQIPHYKINDIKEGQDFTTENGKIIPNKELTLPQKPSYSYAYCSDTAYQESLIPLIKEVDYLYHEASFMVQDIDKAKATLHSTTHDTATIAKEAKVKNLLIGHFSARYDNYEAILEECRSIFENTQIANEGDVIDLEKN